LLDKSFPAIIMPICLCNYTLPINSNPQK
jgi:hypothetical protein